MTFRSKLAGAWVGLVAGAALGAVPLHAQDTLQLPSERPQVHVVQQGETLWGLALLYLGDPLLWPEIYRLNTLVVEDPHWIFPGEALALGPRPEAPVEPTEMPPEAPPEVPPEPLPTPVPGVVTDTTQAAPGLAPLEAPPVEAPPPPPPPPPADPGAATVFAARGRLGGVTLTEASGGAVYRYRPVRRGEFYSAGFLTEGARIPWARVLGNADEPPVDRSIQTSSTVIYQTVEIRAPGGASYQVGDSLLLANLSRQVSGWGNVVIPTGVAVVTHVDGSRVFARVALQFDRVVDGQVGMPLEAFNDPGDVAPLSVENGLDARVITVRDLHPVPNQQDIVFVDRGRQDGIVVGDVLEIREPQRSGGAPPQPVALLQVVHVRERSASGLILQISRPGVTSGQPVRVIRKMPS